MEVTRRLKASGWWGRRKRTVEDQNEWTGRVFGTGVSRKGFGDTAAVDRMKGKGQRGKMERKAEGRIERRAFWDPR